MVKHEMLENTPADLMGDLRYAADKTIRDAAWEDFRRRRGLRMIPPPVMDQLVNDGYFDKARTGDMRGASYFARLVANRLNPALSISSYGWLRKGGGSNVDGYADDAIVANGHPADLFNVYDLVGGSGAPGASPTWNGPLPRRSSDTWAAPGPVPQQLLDYLKPGGVIDPVHPPPPPPPPPPPSPKVTRQEFAERFMRVNTFYGSPDGLQRVGGMVSGVDASVFELLRRFVQGTDTDILALRNACAQVLAVQCDVLSMIQWGYDIAQGATYEQIEAALKQSEEYKAKHRR